MATSPTDFRRSVPSSTCTAIRSAALAVVASCAVLGPPTRDAAAQQPSPSGLGRAPTQAELRAWDLSVGPDGAELPPGSGTVAQGEVVFTQRGCAACHGPTGVEGPGPALVGGKVSLSTNYFPIRYWPFAPPIWDYIKRAMPYDKPGQLTNDEVYALTAFLLYKNEISQESEVMDARTLPKVQMPHRADYKGPSPANWTPDTPRGFKIQP